jgi:hypothetical protein
MSTVVKIATEQGLAFLIGLLFVSVIQPETPGGAVLLILVAIAVVNVIVQLVKLFLGGKKDEPPRDSSTKAADTDLST